MSTLSTFKFDSKLTEIIEEIKKESGATSKSEVVRRAITLLKVAQDGKERGEELFLENPDGSKTRIVLP